MIPFRSTALIISLISSTDISCPACFIASPSSSTEIFPSPFLSNSLKAAAISNMEKQIKQRNLYDGSCKIRDCWSEFCHKKVGCLEMRDYSSDEILAGRWQPQDLQKYSLCPSLVVLTLTLTLTLTLNYGSMKLGGITDHLFPLPQIASLEERSYMRTRLNKWSQVNNWSLRPWRVLVVMGIRTCSDLLLRAQSIFFSLFILLRSWQEVPAPGLLSLTFTLVFSQSFCLNCKRKEMIKRYNFYRG